MNKDVFEQLKISSQLSDEEFNSIYPERIRELDNKHWTPVEVAKTASEFLVNRDGIKVLDIGSGVGKFCMIGASLTKGHFTGVEYRKDLSALSTELSKQVGLSNSNFINDNITNINFNRFDAFYFFNSFIEQMSETEVMDNAVAIDKSLYGKYNQYLRLQFAGMPIGTRLATYWTNSEEIPRGYVLQSTAFEGELKMWEKLF